MKKSTSKLIAEANRIIKNIATERDRLRDIRNDIKDILSSCDEAIDQFEIAIDTLSQYL